MQSFIFYTKKKYFSKPVKTMLVMLLFPPLPLFLLMTERRNVSSIKVLILFNEQNLKTKQKNKPTCICLLAPIIWVESFKIFQQAIFGNFYSTVFFPALLIIVFCQIIWKKKRFVQ